MRVRAPLPSLLHLPLHLLPQPLRVPLPLLVPLIEIVQRPPNLLLGHARHAFPQEGVLAGAGQPLLEIADVAIELVGAEGRSFPVGIPGGREHRVGDAQQSGHEKSDRHGGHGRRLKFIVLISRQVPERHERPHGTEQRYAHEREHPLSHPHGDLLGNRRDARVLPQRVVDRPQIRYGSQFLVRRRLTLIPHPLEGLLTRVQLRAAVVVVVRGRSHHLPRGVLGRGGGGNVGGRVVVRSTEGDVVVVRCRLLPESLGLLGLFGAEGEGRRAARRARRHDEGGRAACRGREEEESLRGGGHGSMFLSLSLSLSRRLLRVPISLIELLCGRHR
mmetsp:Transcript_18898/g.54743  ORF Transcript_18898/g.54743 Transcript_18898/m.54743 type:complete len:331 (+) Transcript_18898:619-1611(+)